MPAPRVERTMELSSPAFDDGGPIPDRYGYAEDNVNPPLRIAEVPDGAASLAVVVEDPDAEPVAGKVWKHWLVWNLPPDRRAIPEDFDPDHASEGRNDFDEDGWGGPDPPSGEHTYVFRAYALDRYLDLSDHATVEGFHRAAADHVLEEATLRGTYAAD